MATGKAWHWTSASGRSDKKAHHTYLFLCDTLTDTIFVSISIVWVSPLILSEKQHWIGYAEGISPQRRKEWPEFVTYYGFLLVRRTDLSIGGEKGKKI